MEDILTNNRICPQPMIWNELYELMCEDLKVHAIPKPLILAGWNFSNDLEKSIRFREHLNLINFDSDNRIKTYILNIEEENWYKG
ncbi:hypothetical protein [Lutibacter flavus]|uniref:Uncharacterized protein n=1 Tax=Lutibacter flavus TaxID=691689 RepID=A0A238VJM5_9FLAO|nr:hypothetical protein [Lutibacter flavus]SNR33903.1 hypothetical protein SAMN04488111_0523 [Lutibacter flavus]